MEPYTRKYSDIENTQYLIAYDVDENNKNEYSDLYDFLNELQAKNIQKSVWIFKHTKSSEDLFEMFKNLLKKNDKIFVTKIIDYHSNSKSINS